MFVRNLMVGSTVLFFMTQNPVFAAEQTQAPAAPAQSEGEVQPASTWDGEAELGFLNTTGNTDTSTTNARFNLENNRPKWQHIFHAEAVRAEDSDNVTAERYLVFTRSRYLLTERSFLFGNLRYEDDEFAGYDQRTTEVVGIGRKFYDSDALKFSAEVGVGARQTDYTTGEETDEGIWRLGADLFAAITETSSFKETFFVESGDENTYTESVSELKLRINAALATKITVTVKNNSDPLPGNDETDTETAVTLVYDF